jgi:Ca-activated chloride channel homolog
LQSGIGLNVILNRTNLQSNTKAAAFLAIDIIPPQVTSTAYSTRPLNVCIAIDCSYSMNDENKLVNAKVATIQLIQSLKPTDLVTLVSFAGRERVEVSAHPARDTLFFNTLINSLKLRYSTNISSALQACLKEISEQQSSFAETPLNKIILLTDGRPNAGKRKLEDFVSICEEIRSNNISVTTLGLGSDYNEELLSAISSITGGLWYHVTDASNLPMLFDEELMSMKTVIMLKPEITIEPMLGTEIVELYKVRPILDIIKAETKKGKYVIPLGDITGGQPQNLVAKISLPPKSKGNYTIAQVKLSGGKTTLTRDVVATYTNNPTLYSKETDPYPRVLLMTSQGTILLRQGVSSGEETIINQAQTILKRTMNDPNAVTVVHSNELTKILVNRFNESYEQTIIKKGNLSEEEKKKVISETTIIKKKKE